MSSNEYTNPMSKGPACGYASLCNYNSNGQMAPLPANARNVSGKYIVPAWNAIGYSALTHGNSASCGGYFGIEAAYGKNAGNCSTNYVTSLCGGCNMK